MNIPVEEARHLAGKYGKVIIIICAWDSQQQTLYTTTYGATAPFKISAAKGGEICATALGMDLNKSEPTEDFRTVDAARNAELRDLAPAIVHILRGYQFGNSAPDPAKDHGRSIGGPSMSSNYAHLKFDSEWRSVFPYGMVPIIEPFPAGIGNMDGAGELANQGMHEFYRVDLLKITPEQRRRIVEMLSRKSGCSKEEVEAGIKEQGCLPITMRHVLATSTYSRAFL